MYILIILFSFQLGLDLLVALMERASVLPKPPPAAWNNMIKCASRLVTVSGAAKPTVPITRSLLTAHTTAADVVNGVEESLAEVLCQN